MSKPLNHRLLHLSLLVIEFALLWLLIELQLVGQAPVSLLMLAGALLVFFLFVVHLIAIATQVIVPRFPVEKHHFALALSVLIPILLALVLTYGMIIGMSYLNGTL